MKILQETRKAQGLSLREAANQAGISNAQISMIETGKRNLTKEVAEKLAEVYGHQKMIVCILKHFQTLLKEKPTLDLSPVDDAMEAGDYNKAQREMDLYQEKMKKVEVNINQRKELLLALASIEKKHAGSLRE